MTLIARTRILLLALLAVLTLCASPAGAEQDGKNGAKDNAAVAEATAAGDSVIDLAFSVRETASEVIDETNTAVAYANCEACRAVAIAFQIVIVQGDPHTVTPQNVAVAVNNECPGCSTLAIAYQFVVGRGEPVEFTQRGLQRLERIREQLKKLEEEYPNLTNEEILARTEAFAAEVRDILANDLVPVDRNAQGEGRGQPIDRESEAQDADGAATTPTPAAPAPAEPPPATPPPPPAPTEPAPTETTAPTETAPTQDPAATTTVP